MVYKVPDDKMAKKQIEKMLLQHKAREAVFQSWQNLVEQVRWWGRSKNYGLGKSLKRGLEAQDGRQSNTEALLRSRGAGCQQESSERWRGLWNWELLQNCPLCGLSHQPWSETRQRKRTASSSAHTVQVPFALHPMTTEGWEPVQSRQRTWGCFFLRTKAIKTVK